ncbi:hypothetical protein F1D05_37215 [Kribbella qitaiheensis]|uniref:Uncharacterized protein n=1 Tax=Kribbella qitaiheensis TaxID=1544730 RepID=A0A7G6X8F0_9ACTN|nr:hypothetical protein [Kribbella qitaiheensis]QNE22515.1 hypothetical protein F1D05_37215 [Kribbella qitaiheensis]
MAFAVARTTDEAHLYVELTPCEDCGALTSEWSEGLTSVDGSLATSYVGACPGCGIGREFLFGVPAVETPPGPFPQFGGAEPSEIFDAGQWLEIADYAAGDVPVDDPVEAERRLALAQAAVDEVVKFIPAGEHAVPDDAFWTDEGSRIRAEEPGRFRLERLLVVRDSYRYPARGDA